MFIYTYMCVYIDTYIYVYIYREIHVWHLMYCITLIIILCVHLLYLHKPAMYAFTIPYNS